MSITRYGAGERGAGGQPLPFARAVEADGWLHVSGQVAMENGEIIDGGIVAQTHKTMQNLIAILHEAGYGLEHVVRAGVWLDDPRDFLELQQGVRRILRRPRSGARLRAILHDGGLQGRDRLHRLQTQGLR
ncbi:enamine deaminase RidA (YjgF/YER057c/UK114 family) [Pseudomonas psychrotolerans]|nr:enamine deaminase RidA (YjgF/YER057c/UK114 family) [Pseudomonas psychrotolerans]